MALEPVYSDQEWYDFYHHESRREWDWDNARRVQPEDENAGYWEPHAQTHHSRMDWAEGALGLTTVQTKLTCVYATSTSA